jgi:uncharacterized protein (TIGR02117 family)
MEASAYLVRRSVRLAAWVGAGLLAALALYAAAAAILGLIAVNTDFREPDAGIPIYIRGNGVHTDIVVPWHNHVHDWREEFPQADAADAMPFISFGWGDRRLYLETPTWGHLRTSVAFMALTGLGQSTMRVEFAGLPMADFGDVILRLPAPQYGLLVETIRASFQHDVSGRPITVPTPDYALGQSSYYEAFGSYSILSTCNDWTRRTLTAAGIRMPLWSPFYPAIFYQLRRIQPA